ncbi:MAG: InlB B-repeat-containing protein, partial [Candidatus Nanopelagicales bacterium]|nr:InlB B-repeat-containing protein [Candidatus Nanopelagicales bacterium]
MTANVYWNQEMITRKGHRDRFNVRLVALGLGAASPVVLKDRSRRTVPSAVQHVTFKLGKKKAKKLRAASSVALTVSQQYGLRGRHHNKFFRQYVTVVGRGSKQKPHTLARVALSPTMWAGRDCGDTEIKPGLKLSRCNLRGANLSRADLRRVNLSRAVLRGCDLSDAHLRGVNLSRAVLRGCDLSRAVLRRVNLSGAHLRGANLSGAVFGGITGTPASLPAGWHLSPDGSLVPYEAALSPVFDAPVSTGDGFTVNVTNYDGAFTWGATATGGGVSIDGSGLVTVTGLDPGAGSTVTVTTTRTGYATGSADVAGEALPNMTVTFNANDGTGDMAAQLANVPTALTANAFTRAGYTFTGWNTADDGTGSAYADGAEYAFTEDVTLYAQWSANSYPVAYDGNGFDGGSAPASASHATDSTVTVADNTGELGRAGYTFTGWNTAANGSDTSYAPDDEFTMPPYAVTLYAQWSANSYPVAYDGNGFTDGSVPASASHETDSTVTVADNTGALIKTGYTFTGWNTQAGGGGDSYEADDEFTMPAYAVTL